MGGAALDWIKSYLDGRAHFVKVSDQVSSTVRSETGVPQGSVLGPLLFSAYVSPIDRLVASFGIKHVSYADDITLYVNLDGDAKATTAQLNNCAVTIARWLMFNDLRLNPTKSELLKVGTRQQIKSLVGDGISIAGADIKPSTHIKLLGVTLDGTLSFDQHISGICINASFHLRALRHNRNRLDKSTANTIACSFVASRLDYCNAVLAGMSSQNILRLQRVQNRAARIVVNSTGKCNVTAILKELHWLPIAQRINYKVALTTFKVLTVNQPSYIRSMLNISVPKRVLRSSSNGVLLDVPFCKTATASRAFSCYAPKLWNTFAQLLRDSVSLERGTGAVSLDSFQCMLKTFFFLWLSVVASFNGFFLQGLSYQFYDLSLSSNDGAG